MKEDFTVSPPSPDVDVPPENVVLLWRDVEERGGLALDGEKIREDPTVRTERLTRGKDEWEGERVRASVGSKHSHTNTLTL